MFGKTREMIIFESSSPHMKSQVSKKQIELKII